MIKGIEQHEERATKSRRSVLSELGKTHIYLLTVGVVVVRGVENVENSDNPIFFKASGVLYFHFSSTFSMMISSGEQINEKRTVC